MENLIRQGETLTYTNSSEAKINAGDVVVIGALLGVAVTDIPAGGKGAVHLWGVYELPKTTSQAWTAGAKLTLVAATGKFSTGAASANGDFSGNAVAFEAAASAATTGKVLINVGPGTAYSSG